jgi:outer membrane protein assembly factor BamB
MGRIAVLAFELAVLVVPVGAAAEPSWWPQFRGPNGCGVSHEDRRLPVQFAPSKNVVWKTALPPGHSSPCVWGNRIFVTCFEESQRQLETVCLDRDSGKVLWRRTAPAAKIEKVHPIGNPAAATPATDGQRVYVYFGSFGLLCYDFDGQVQWQKPLPFPTTEFGTGTSPIVVDDLVILNAQGPGLLLMAVRRKTGETAWTKEAEIGYSVPILWDRDGARELIVSSSVGRRALAMGTLTSYNLDGTERWSVRGLPANAFTTPVVGDGLLFVNFTIPGGDPQDWTQLEPFEKLVKKYDRNKDGFLSLDEFPQDFILFEQGVGMPGTPGGDITVQRAFARIAGADQKIDQEEWNRVIKLAATFRNALVAVRPGARGTLEDSQVAWRATRSLPEIPSPLYYRGCVYLFRKGGIASCLDARSGKEHYSKRLRSPGSYYSSPVAGDGKVYIASESGMLFVIEAGPVLKVLAQNNLQDRIMATPAIAAGTLYVRTEKTLYAFRE